MINQDLIVALGLMQDGDRWLRVDEGYIDVIRQRRSSDRGDVVAIEMRAEHLRDYLRARGMALKVVRYRSRAEVLQDASHVPWYQGVVESGGQGDRHVLRTYKIDSSGGLHGGNVAVFTVRRTDVDPEADVPVFDRETEENTESEHREFERGGASFDRVEGEWWKDDWIEAADRSDRVRGDAPAEELFFATSSSGERMGARALNHEDIGRYLWFKPEVMEALLSYRGSALSWFTRSTGQVKCSPDYSVPFGVSESCRINVYAYDVARLPQWQQRIWHGFNVTPDGPPSTELLAAQMECRPARTRAPEEGLSSLITDLNALFIDTFGGPLFKPHDSTPAILRQCHRFRATANNGLLALAKDVTRVTADSIDQALLTKLIALKHNERLGSLKLLERLLEKYVVEADARRIMGPMHVAYGLRLGDAHLPSAADIAQSLSQLSATETTHPVDIAIRLLSKVCQCLHDIGATVSNGAAPAASSSPSADQSTR